MTPSPNSHRPPTADLSSLPVPAAASDRGRFPSRAVATSPYLNRPLRTLAQALRDLGR